MKSSVPVVFVHGIRLSGACWDQQRHLLRDRDSIAIDLPAHGSRRGEPFTIDTAVTAVTDAIDALGGRAVVVGHSLGGYVSIATAARSPERVAALVGFGCTLVPHRYLLRGFALANSRLQTVPDSAPWSMPRMLRRVLPAEVVDPVLASGIAFEATPSALRALEHSDPIGALRSFGGRVALVNGGHDHFRIGEQRFATSCSDGHLHVVPGAGHYLPLTHGRQSARIVGDIATLADADRNGASGRWGRR